MLSVLKGLWIVFMHMFRKRETVQYPDEKPLFAPRYRGPVLIRGGRLDQAGRLRFDWGNVPPLELRIPKVASGDRGRPSFTRLRAPGCYAYQIDGTSFSRVIVFQAVLGE
jgi:hypothetical protein